MANMSKEEVRPTIEPAQLDVINRPSPVEPNTFPDVSHNQPWERQQHRDLYGARQEKSYIQSSGASLASSDNPITSSTTSSTSGSQIAALLNPAIDTRTDPKRTSRLDSSGNNFTLPRPSQHDMPLQRTQFPPVLQGLHQPPPNAGLLPSMIDNVKEAYPLRGRGLPHSASQGLFLFDSLDFSSIPSFSTDSKLYGLERDRSPVADQGISPSQLERRSATYPNILDDVPHDDTSGKDAVSTSRDDPATTADEDLSLPTAVPKTKQKRRPRTKWSPDEDAALLAGLKRYGPSWSCIQIDPILKKRTPTDIRDRIRTRFPTEYAKTGLAPKTWQSRRSAPRPEHAASDEASGAAPSKGDAAAITSPVQSTSATRELPPLPVTPEMNADKRHAWFEDTPFNMIPMNFAGPGSRRPPTDQQATMPKCTS